MSVGKDIALVIQNNCWDLILRDGDLLGDDGLETAIVISLFTDKRVREEQLPVFTDDKKGWWGDMFPSVESDQIGSRLWTLKRSKVTNETLRLHEDYAKEALEHLITDGVVKSFEVNATYNDDLQLELRIDLVRPENNKTRFNLLWDNQAVRIINEDINNGV